MTITTQCPVCKHYQGVGICEAYSEGIPAPILLGEYDHREPYKGDSGIRYEPLEGIEDDEASTNN